MKISKSTVLIRKRPFLIDDKDRYDENDVKKKYEYALENANLSECPSYWGGFQFKPYEIEFWEGHKARLNKRDVFLLNGDEWIHNILEP